MKSIIELPLIRELESALKSKNGLIQVILGPRQVGKTTSVLKLLYDKYKNKNHYVSADKIFNANSKWILEQWQEARRKKHLLVIDEIQKIENWAEVVKVLWDEDKRHGINIQCVLLGSSSLDIHKGLSESLTGRFQLIRAYHWNYHESQEGYKLSFNNFLKFGGYPASYQFINNPIKWGNYLKHSIIETVIEKDILQSSKINSPSLFKQAFEIILSYPAQEISYTKLLGQLQDKGNTDLIKYYLKLYEGAFLIKVLEKFSPNKIKTKSSSPKILPLAPALFFVNLLNEYDGKELGRVFELIVGSQLVRTGLELFYWREGDLEVDYILKLGKSIWAIEVKSSHEQKSSKGLNAFKLKFPNAKLVIINMDNYLEFEKNPLSFLKLT